MVQDKKIETLDTVLEERHTLGLLDTQYRKAWGAADRQMKIAQAIMVDHGDAEGMINDDALYEQYRKHVDSSLYFQRQADGIKRLAEAHVETHGDLVKVKSEPRTYSPLRDASWFCDRASVVSDPTGQTAEGAQAAARLARYSQELATTVRNDPNSTEGRHVLRAVREQYRTTDVAGRSAREITHEAERRAATSGPSSLGAFVTPVYVLSEAAQYRSPVAAFTDESTSVPMPQYGLTLHVPSFTSATDVGEQVTENTGIDTDVPTGGYISDPIPVVTQAGYVNISQQLFDRGGQPGSGFDAILFAELADRLDYAVEQYVLATVIAMAQTVTDSTTLTVPRFYTDLSTAREQMSDAAGVRLKPSHVFGTTDFLEWLFDQVDDSKRPLIVPDVQALIAAPPTGSLGVDNTFTGVFLNRQRLFEADAIPAYTGEATWTQVLVADMKHVLTWRSEAISVVAPEFAASDLSVLCSLRQYVAALARHADAVQVLSGAGYASLK